LIRGWKKRTSAAKAGYSGVIDGTAEAVPFLQDRVRTQTLKPLKYVFPSSLDLFRTLLKADMFSSCFARGAEPAAENEQKERNIDRNLPPDPASMCGRDY
jgi:hypothetical protein